MAPRIFDLHCDTPMNILKGRFGHIHPKALTDQGYIGAVFAHWVAPGSATPFVDAVRMLSATIQYLEALPGCRIIRQPEDFTARGLNILLGVEGGHIFDRDPHQIEVLYDLGVRVFTLLWNNSNRLGHSALDNDQRGLTAAGRSFLRAIAPYRIYLDLSHASTRTVVDVCGLATNPVFASHSCVRALNPQFLRNINDEAARAITGRGGVIAVNFSNKHLGGRPVIEHIDYLKQRFGSGAVCIGSDFDGIDDPVIPAPGGVPQLAADMRQRGYEAEEITGILSANAIRFFSLG